MSTAPKKSAKKKQVLEQPSPTAPECFPVKVNLRLLPDQDSGRISLKSVKDKARLKAKLSLPGDAKWLRFEMRRIMRTSLLDDSKQGYPAHKAWRYCRLFEQLWACLVRMIEHAQNPNTRNQAARTLGRIIHELGTREGVRWKQNLIDSNEEFKNAVFPYGPGGGKPPKDDLIRWVRAEMTSLERLWLIAAKVAHRVSIGTFRTLRASWEYYLQGRPRQLSHHERELSNHPFAQLDFAALSDFRLLWDSALCQLFKAKWNREKKNRELDIQGEKSFPKRFGDQNHPEAGYFAAERHFNRWWRTKLESAIRTEKLIRERHTARQRELMNRPPESRSIDEEVELAEIQALIEEV